MDEEEEVEGGNDEGEETKIECQKNIKQMLTEATRMHLLLAKNFFKAHLAQKSSLRFEGYNYDTSCFELE